MKIAVVGATGLVGSKMLQVLEERNFPVTELIPVASEKSVGKQIVYKGTAHKVVSYLDAIAAKPAIALFSAGGKTSLELAPKFANAGIYVIDNSSAWRMHPDCPLIVPEVNGDVLLPEHTIIANPNCSTIQMVVALKPIHDQFVIKRIVVSTYQSVTGTGVKAVQQLQQERIGAVAEMAYPYPIDMNVIPQIDVFSDGDYTKEELKMMRETKKIMQDDQIAVTATCVRIPVMGGHSESVNVSCEKSFTIDQLKQIFKTSAGLTLQDDIQQLLYPMPLYAHDKDDVFIGRIRIDETFPNTFNCWIVSDNLRKGAATNAVQIAELLVEKSFVVK